MSRKRTPKHEVLDVMLVIFLREETLLLHAHPLWLCFQLMDDCCSPVIGWTIFIILKDQEFMWHESLIKLNIIWLYM